MDTGSQKLTELAEKAEGNYKTHLRELSFEKEFGKKARELLDRDLDDRANYWEKQIKSVFHKEPEFPKLANPYYIGFGNPDADILFIGKENAFDPWKNPELFFEESINNTLHWRKIQNGECLNRFDPRFSKSSDNFYGKINSNKTWGFYAYLVRLAKGIGIPEKEFRNERKSRDRSFFDHCFMTEINHRPMKYSLGNEKKLTDKRKEHLKHEFYKSFPVVVMGINDYLGNIEKERKWISKLFNAEPAGDSEGENGLIQFNKQQRKARIYCSDHQRIIVCYQLSGSAGWTNEAKEELGKWMKKGLK